MSRRDRGRRRRTSAGTTGVLLSALSVFALISGGVVVVGAARPEAAAAAAGDPVIATAGDIACPPGATPASTHCQQAKTGDVLNSINPSVVVPLGDTQYASGTPEEYAGSYDKVAWGTSDGTGGYKSVSRPAVGNHEYRTAGAAGYYGYFGSNAGDPSKGYYSYDIIGPNGSFRWHVIALNTECANVGGCGVGSAEETWLKADLAANPNTCTMAYSHRPRFSSGSTVPSSTTYVPFWNDLYNAGADVVLNGHAHHYERFDPQTSSGAADPNGGLREFIVGTGGDDFQTLGAGIANSVVRNNDSFGALKMTLHANSYDWEFVPAAGYSFTDSGTASCHAAPGPDGTPPTQPTNLTASASSPNQVNFGWTASSDNVTVTGYRIYRGANGSTPTLLTTTTNANTTYADTSVIAGTPYQYQVQAIDAAGNASAMSLVASVTTPTTTDTTPPTTPTNLTGEAITSSEVDLNWTASSDTGTGISGYRVYRAPSGSTSFSLIATTIGSGVSYADLTVTGNTRYDYQVMAVDGASNTSPASNTFTASTPPGAVTQNYTFTATGDATIDQTNATTNYGGDVTKLIVDGSPSSDALLKFNVATTGCSTVTSASLQLTNNANGSPTGGDIYSTGSSWTESTVNWNNAPGRGVLLNSLGAVVSKGVYTVDVTGGVSSTNGEVDFRIGSPNSDGAYYFPREASTSSFRPQLRVVCAEASTDTLAPTAPTSLGGSAPNGGEVDLAWQPSTDNVAVTEYRIYRNGVVIATVPASASSYHDTTTASQTSYSYRVSARDAANNESPLSNTFTTTTPK